MNELRSSLQQPVRPAARPASQAPTPRPRVFPTPSPAHQHLLASPEALETPVALPAVPAPGECPPVFTVTPPTPLAPPPTLVPLPASSCGSRDARVAANGFHRPLSPPPSCRGEGDVPPCFGGGVPRNGLLPDDGTRDEVAHVESTASTMIVDVMRTGST